MQPNIFNLATRELSHDAFFTWLLQWAHPKFNERNIQLHELGKAFLKLVLDVKFVDDINELQDIEAGRQWENIDVWAEIFCANRKILLILENKTFTAEHSDQLIRYQQTGKVFCEQKGFELSCAYVKTGSETQKLINSIKEKGYKTIQRKDLLGLFNDNKCNHPLVTDYRDHLQQLENSHNEYMVRVINNWDGPSWVGFYQHIEDSIPVNMWHFVNNPSGGFWNLSLTWKYWDDIPVYTQIEQGKITFKVALSEDETGMSNDEIDINAVQDFIHQELLSFAKARNFIYLERPYPMVHRGAYRAVAIIRKEVWMGDIKQLVNLEQAVLFLKHLNSFYEAFIEQLRSLSYQQFKIVPGKS